MAAYRVAYMRKYRSENAAKIAVQVREHRNELGEAYREADRQHSREKYQRHRQKYLAEAKMRYAADHQAWRTRTAENARKRREADPDGERAKVNARARRRRLSIKERVSYRMSNRLWRALKRSGGKRKAWIEYVDYSVDDLVERLSTTMPPGYTWADFLKGELHIDHVKPIASFSYASTDDQSFRDCWALSNLQLLPAADNLKKNARLDWPAPQAA